MNPSIPRDALAVLKTVLLWEHPRLAVLGSHEKVVFSTWRRFAAEYPHHAMEILLDETSQYELIRKLPPSEHVPAFLGIARSDNASSRS